jgi:hypothetical protein
MKLTIEISDEDAMLIKAFLRACGDPKFCSHGTLTMRKLAEMLMEDVALSVRRPGSWEGANMRQVLASHGYDD